MVLQWLCLLASNLGRCLSISKTHLRKMVGTSGTEEVSETKTTS